MRCETLSRVDLGALQHQMEKSLSGNVRGAVAATFLIFMRFFCRRKVTRC